MHNSWLIAGAEVANEVSHERQPVFCHLQCFFQVGSKKTFVVASRAQSCGAAITPEGEHLRQACLL